MSASYPRTQNILICLQLLASFVACLAGLSAGYWLKFHTSLFQPVLQRGGFIPYQDYLPIIGLGSLFLMTTFVFMNLHDVRLTFRPRMASYLILRAIFLWLLIFLSTSAILKFEPAISRLFVIFSCIFCFLLMVGWRYLLYNILSRSVWRQRLMQRIAFVGWSDEASKLASAVGDETTHPDQIAGLITTGDSAATNLKEIKKLGHISDIENILSLNLIDTVVIADLDLTKNQMIAIAGICERRYINYKVIPSFFQIFVSNLRMQTIAGVPILGLDQPVIEYAHNRWLKRLLDVVGGTMGVLLFTPVMVVLGLLIKAEEKGPALFVQERIGRKGKRFKMIKLRSMRIGADAHDQLAQSTSRTDSRMLRIGKFIRRWNLDELPQFWNVLRGDMSLVGPRPERTFHAEKLSSIIPNYSSRHIVIPGMTGWAQVHGLRGECDLATRIKYDLYYIENWSLWLDFQIIILTFLNRKNAY